MKRAKRLFDQLAKRENLRQAFWKALRGKRMRPDAQAFAANLDANLQQLSEELQSGRVRVGDSHQFTIYDPKERLITAPAFRERVLHHAILNVCEPIFERRLIDETFACRRGKGRLKALDRAATFSRRFGWFLKLDVRKYFDSISHEILQSQLQRLFADQRLLDVFAQILGSYQTSSGYGLPIGSLTSQHFANLYLAPFDRFVKETLRVKGYVRYMDDCVLWGAGSRLLKEIRLHVLEFLQQELGLSAKGEPYINRSVHGLDFLGCRVFSKHTVLNRRSRTRFQRNLRHLERAYQHHELTSPELQRRATALVAFTQAGSVRSWQFRQRVLQKLVVGDHGLEPCQSGRKLEQHRQELPVREPEQE